MKIRSHLLVASAIFAVLTAACQAGVYVKGTGLYNKPSDVSVNNLSAFRASLKSNVGAAASLGYKFSLLRAEVELQRLRSNVESDEFAGNLLAGVTSSVGSIKETAGFANGFVDLPGFLGLSPYVGVGLGYARINLDGLGRLRNNVPVSQFSGSDTVFGYQGMVGLQFRVFGTATINAGYRMIKRQDVAVRDVAAAATQSLKLGDNRMFELGLTVGF